jgi:sodium-dependent dicarboxylate transporter 2/3/5
MKKKGIIGLVLAAAILACSFLIPESAELTRTGITTIAMLLSFLVIMVSEAFPLVVSCFIFLALMPVLGVTASLGEALSGFANKTLFFVLSSFMLADAFKTVPITKRVLIGLLKKFGKNVSSMLFALMAVTLLFSSVISNVPVCAIFMAIGLSLLDLYDEEAAKKSAGRAIMIGVSVATMIGGIITPAGSSINILALNLLEEQTGTTVTFMQWMLAGIPIAVVALPFAWFVIAKIYKPANFRPEMVEKFINNQDVPKKLTRDEIKVLSVTGVMLVLWIASSWVPAIDVTVVSVLGGCLFFLPGLKILEIKPFLRNASWESYFIMGTVMSMGTVMVTNGVSSWIGGLMPAMNAPSMVVIGFIALLTFLLLIVIPAAPSLVTIMAGPMITFALGAGVSPAFVMLALAVCANNCFFLPLDTVTLLTYGTGYYSMGDLPKSGSVIQVFLIIIVSLWLPVIGRLCGIA